MSKKYMGSDKGLIKLIELIKTHFEQLSCDDLKSVSTEASQGLTDTEKTNARNNIGALATNGDSKSNTVTFTSNDVDDGSATSWTSVSKLTSGITHKTFLERVSQMFKNVRYLYKMLGTTDISKIGDGTITGGISSLNSNLKQLEFNNLSGGKNVFDLSKIDFINVEYRNGVYTNKNTDSKTFFEAYIDYWNDDGFINSYADEMFSADAKGKYSITGKIIEGCTKIRLKHNGTTEDITFFVTQISYFGLEVGDTFTISMDVDGYNASVVGGLVVKNIQIEKGTQATPYEPYIPSVKMLAEEVSAQNESLDDYGLVAKEYVSNDFLQGVDLNGNITSNNYYVCNKNIISANVGDTITVKSIANSESYVAFYDGSTFKSIITIPTSSINNFVFSIPSGSNGFRISIGVNTGVTPSTIGKVSVYVNNEIDKLKNYLAELDEVLLWENPSSKSITSTITLNYDYHNYKYICIEYIPSYSGGMGLDIIKKRVYGDIKAIFIKGDNGYKRTITISPSNPLNWKVSDCTDGVGNTNDLIPKYIYGIKN